MKGSEQKKPLPQSQGDPYRAAPVFTTNLALSIYEDQLAVITFFSGVPVGTQDDKEVIVGSFAITRTHAAFLAEALAEFLKKGELQEKDLEVG